MLPECSLLLFVFLAEIRNIKRWDPHVLLERSWGGVLGTDQLGEAHVESPDHQGNKWKDEERHTDDQGGSFKMNLKWYSHFERLFGTSYKAKCCLTTYTPAIMRE